MDILSPAVVELERAYREINRDLFKGVLPTAIVMTIQSKGRKSALAWFWPGKWQNEEKDARPEINFSAENLADGPIKLLERLVHEMVHAWNAVRKIKDCGKNGRYHNKRFKLAAEEIGLTVERSKAYGYGHTNLTTSLRERLSQVNLREEPFTLYRLTREGKGKQGTRLVKWSCACPRNFWAKTDMSGVKCEFCSEYFSTA